MIHFNCPKCDHQLHAPDNARGRAGRCKHCNSEVAVPAANNLSEDDVAAFLSSDSDCPRTTQPARFDESTDAVDSFANQSDADDGNSIPLPVGSASNDVDSQSEIPQPEKKPRRKSIAEMDEEDYQKRKQVQSGLWARTSNQCAIIIEVALTHTATRVLLVALAGYMIFQWSRPEYVKALNEARQMATRCSSLKPGMTRSDVENLLGPPHEAAPVCFIADVLHHAKFLS